MHRFHEAKRTACRTVSVFTFVLALAIAANAYTVVTRGGRRLEIPSQFVVTASTLTYEVSPGVQVTLLMDAINISATEKANNEPPGSLLRRAGLTVSGAASPAQAAVQPAAPARRTITNDDLKSTALRRRESELAYEDRRKQLGLPSVEESRRQAEAESELIKKDLEQQSLAASQTENYWRERAVALRTEMAAVDAEINWVRARLDEGPASGYAWNGWNGWSGGSFTTVIGGATLGNFGRGHGTFGGNFGGRGGFHTGRPTRPARPGVFVAPNRGPQIGATRGRVLNPGFRPARPNTIAGGSPIFSPGFPGGVVFGSGPAYDYSYERGELITRFNELAGSRAALNARFRELEEEARRAGASPGWLRP